MSFLGKIINALGGGRFLFVLCREQSKFYLMAFRGNKPINIAQLVNQYPRLRGLERLATLDRPSIAIRLSQLIDVRLILQTVVGEFLHIHISPAVLMLNPCPAPQDFAVQYNWSAESRCLVRELPTGTSYFGEGWFATTNAYWHTPNVKASDDVWLVRERIERSDIIEFIKNVTPNWQERNLPFTCRIGYTPEPALSISVATVTDERVTVKVHWVRNPAEISGIAGVSDHVIALDSLRPGISPSASVKESASLDPTLELNGEQIPEFLEETWPCVSKWAQGGVDQLFQRHRIFSCQAKIKLDVLKEERDGVGIVTAKPIFMCGDFQCRADDLSRAVTPDARFVRLSNGWIDAEKLKDAGIGPFGRATDGTPLGPTALTAGEILKGGSNRLKGPWDPPEFPPITLPSGQSSLEVAKAHLDFLREWGVPGGIVGPIGSYQAAFFHALTAIVDRTSKPRVLIVAARKTFDQLAPSWAGPVTARFDGLLKDPEFRASTVRLALVTPKALETIPGLTSLTWTVICLLEADALVKTTSSRLFENLCECRKALALGSFLSADFLKHNAQRRALAQVFGIPVDGGGELVWKYGLRNPEERIATLPRVYVSTSALESTTPVGYPAEFNLGSAPTPAGLPIPNRTGGMELATEISGSLSTEPVKIGFQTSFSREEGGFVEQARTFVNKDGAPASFIPFMHYWPTYAVMTDAQLKWYFYWRGQVRGGTYPDTDLSYIFVHVYELINNVGVANSLDGYQQLRGLWLNYRSRYPNLDHYLIDWTCDYIILNPSEVDPLQPYLDALSLKVHPSEPDLLLQHYSAELVNMPLVLIEAFSTYRLTASKFCKEGHRAILERVIRESLDQVDRHLTKKSGKGILDEYRPRESRTIHRHPFQSALYVGPSTEIRVGTVFCYSLHQPFRDFLASCIKHTENTLREILGFRGRLRGYQLDSETAAVIEAFVKGEGPLPGPHPEKAPLVIDLSRVDDLTRESDAVRDILLKDSAQGSEGILPSSPTPAHQPLSFAQHVTTKIPRPEGTPAHLLTDLDPVYEVLKRLDSEEMSLLTVLMARNWETDEQSLRENLPGILLEVSIDHINELASKFLGDLLVHGEGGRKVVAEDFRDELDYLLTHCRDQLGPRGEESSQAGGLAPEWEDLRSRLTTYQLDALKAILEQADPTEEIARIADSNTTMPELLLDSINEAAVDAIGDVIIAPGSHPPIIEDEDRDMVEKLVLTMK